MTERSPDTAGMSFGRFDQRAPSVTIAQRDPAAPEPELAPDVIVGLGNEIAADDGVGIEVARLLSDRLAECPTVDVVALPWAGFALLDVLRGRTRAAIVDCLISGRHPAGTIVRIDETQMGGSVRLNSFHDISYPTAMALGRAMGWDMPHQVEIWGIEAASTDTFSECLTPQVAAAVPVVADEIGAFLRTSPVPQAEATVSSSPR